MDPYHIEKLSQTLGAMFIACVATLGVSIFLGYALECKGTECDPIGIYVVCIGLAIMLFLTFKILYHAVAAWIEWNRNQ